MAGEAVWSSRWSFKDGANPTLDSTSVRWDFNSDTVKKTRPILRTQGLRGTRSRITKNTRWGPYSVAGTLGINPSPAFLGPWLVRAMGGGSSTAPAMADTLTEFGGLFDRGTGSTSAAGACYKALGLKVNRLTLSGRAEGLVECSIDVLGKTWASASFAGAALGTTLAYEPYAHSDVQLTFDSGSTFNSPIALNVLDWSLSLENNLTARFNNSLSADAILEGERVVMLKATVAVDDTAADFTPSMTDNFTKDGAAATLVLTNSTVSTSFSFASWQIPDESITRQGNELVFEINSEIRGTTGAEFTVTNDLTP